MAAGPDDQQLIRIVQHLAKLHLEIERGVRDPDQLATMMRPEARLAWLRIRPRGRLLPGGPATDADLGAVHLRRTNDGDILASITTPTLPGRRGALTFVLHIERNRITVRQAQRLHPGLDYGRRTGAERTGHPNDRLDAALAERRAVLAAIESSQRLAVEGTGQYTHMQAPRWREILGRLDTEIATLMRTDLQRHFDGHDPKHYRAAGSRKSH